MLLKTRSRKEVTTVQAFGTPTVIEDGAGVVSQGPINKFDNTQSWKPVRRNNDPHFYFEPGTNGRAGGPGAGPGPVSPFVAAASDAKHLAGYPGQRPGHHIHLEY